MKHCYVICSTIIQTNKKNNIMKITIITLSVITLLILGLRLELNQSYEVYNTKDLKTVKLHYAELNNGLTVYSNKLTKFWFFKDSNFKHFKFKVRKSNNLFGTEKGTILFY